MEGTETGWDRPAEPAPRWRALLERARLGGRTGEQPELGRGGRARSRPIEQPPGGGYLETQPPSGGYLETRPPGGGYLETRPPGGGYLETQPIGYPAELGYAAEPTYAPEPGYAPDPGHTTEPGYGAVPGYGVEPGYAVPAYEPAAGRPTAYAPSPGYGSSHGAGYPPTAYGSAEAAHPARIEWRETRPDAAADRAAAVLRGDLGVPRVLAFANPKGGVHKTTATVLAAATVGSVRGRGVLAWDDNELRGTLGLRAGSARHARTIRHLIADLIEIEASHGFELTDRLDDYLRHASDGSYDVLAGEENPRFAQQLDRHTVRRVLELLRRTHDVICVDTGNNVESANWQTVLQAADQLVVTTVPREDAAFSADWMLDLLHEVGMGELADNAVTLLSCPTPGPSPLLDDFTKHFATRTRAVAVVPYDPALETGSSIEYVQLQPETRQAWLQAASVMLEPFAR